VTQMWGWLNSERNQLNVPRSRVLKQGIAERVIFFYPGEEGTFIENAQVTLFENGAVHVKTRQEETTTHLQNLEIQWRLHPEHHQARTPSKLRLLKQDANAPTDENSRPDPTPDVH
jgi:hypothetical protein